MLVTDSLVSIRRASCPQSQDLKDWDGGGGSFDGEREVRRGLEKGLAHSGMQA